MVPKKQHMMTAWAAVNRIPVWLKACVAVLLIGAMILQLDWSTFARQLHTLRWPIIATVALLFPTALLLNAAKWSSALRLHDLNLRFNYLFRAGCVGYFVNNLLPTAIGGDIYRVYRTSGSGSTSQAVSAVLLERFVGLAIMLLHGLVGAVFRASTLRFASITWPPPSCPLSCGCTRRRT